MFEKIFLSPSNQSDNTYAYGNTNEAAVCGEIAKYANLALIRCNFQTMVMQWESAQERCRKSNEWGANMHIPIHTNAFDKNVTGTRTFVYEKKGEAYEAAKIIHAELAALTPGTSENISTYPQLIELKQPKALAIYLEVDFHDVSRIAKWLIENVEAIGECICKAVCKYYKRTYIEPGKEPAKPVEAEKVYKVQVGAFTYKHNAENMLKALKAAGFNGFIKEEEVEVAEEEEKEEEPVVKLGSKVRVKQGAQTYTGGNVATFVYNNVYTVDELVGKRAVLDVKGICTPFNIDSLIVVD